MSRKRYTPYRARRQNGLIAELRDAVKPSLPAEPVSDRAEGETAQIPSRIQYQAHLFSRLIGSAPISDMDEDEASHMHNPALPGDGSMRWVLGACGTVVLLLLILTIVYFS